MAIITNYKDVEIKIFVEKETIHLTKFSREPLSLNKLMKIKNLISKKIAVNVLEYEVHIFNAA